MKTENKSWYKSKTKLGTVLVGIGPVLATLGAMLSGSVDFMTGVQSLAVQVGVVLAIFGVRDLPFINVKK